MSNPARKFVVSRPTELSPEDTEEGIRILYDAFSTHPVMRAIAGHDDDLLKIVFQTRLDATITANALWVARNHGGKLVGVMITNLPGADSGASAAIPKDGTHSWRDGIEKSQREWLDNVFYPTFVKFNNAFGPNGYKDDVYVNLLAVPSEARKQGIGRALMDEAWAEALRRKIKSSLITQGDYNVKLYTSMGYKTIDFIDTDIRGETIRSYAMIRQA